MTNSVTTVSVNASQFMPATLGISGPSGLDTLEYRVAVWLEKNGAFRDGLNVGEVADVIWTLTSPEVHRLLRDGCGWSHERFARWLEDTLVRTLLPDS